MPVAAGKGRAGVEDRSPTAVWPESMPLGLRATTLYPQEFCLSLGLPPVLGPRSPSLLRPATPPAPFPATFFPGSADTAHVENAAAAAASSDGAEAARCAMELLERAAPMELLERAAPGSPAAGPDLDIPRTRVGGLRFGA